MNFTVSEPTDPLMIKAAKYSSIIYKHLLDSIKTLNLTMYDMRCSDIVNKKNYTDIMDDLLRKNIGVAWQSRNPKPKFQLLAKWSHSKKFGSMDIVPIYPDQRKSLKLI